MTILHFHAFYTIVYSEHDFSRMETPDKNLMTQYQNNLFK